MSDRNSDSPSVAESWESNSNVAPHDAAYTSGSIGHPAILSFWGDFFRVAKSEYDTPKVIDIASGNGTVVECANSAFDGQLSNFTCLDVSAAAINVLKQRFPAVRTIVADACSIPLDSASYDLATSQFGIEYAGLDAMDEITRLIAPGGQLALLLHHQAGGIYREYAASLDALERMQQARFIPYAIAMFEEGFAACRGADRAKYEAAAKQLAPAVQTLESIMMQHGQHVAGDIILRLYTDVGKIHEGIQHYEPSEVLDWLHKMDDELHSFARRMASMRDAAIDSKTFDRLCEGLRKKAYTIKRAEPFTVSGQQLPLAWVLIAVRDSAKDRSKKLAAARSEELAAWPKERLEEAVEEMMRLGVVTDALVEARPVWALPNKIMIGQVRDAGDPTIFKWVISGDVPTDYLDSAVAATPREAARHFAMKWHLESARYQDPSARKTLGPESKQDWDDTGRQLAEKAEALFALVEDKNLWHDSDRF
ncbi:MAG: DUF4826 family protein [Gammaproteobacteria bacterium]|jgi:ubiquinone/menaquinone biosynthesis C-methylase UbiE|nr:DUF4826 family protein [Gammaproteobacteria bacterium]